MSKTEKLKATARKITGSKVKTLRNEGILPANIFGAGKESLAIQITQDDFKTVYENAGETGIIEVSVGDDTRNVLISDMQTHPVSDEILHVDFMEVDLKKKVGAAVPVEIIGEAPIEKSGEGIVVQQTLELEVEALPLELPDRFELDVSEFDSLESMLTVADIKVDASKVEILAEPDQIIVNVTEVREEEEEPVVVEGEEGVVEGEGEAGETPEGEESEAGEEGGESTEDSEANS